MMIYISVILFKSNLVGIPENRNAGPYKDQKPRIRDPSVTQAGPYQNGKSGPRTLEGPYKKRKTGAEDPSEILEKPGPQ